MGDVQYQAVEADEEEAEQPPEEAADPSEEQPRNPTEDLGEAEEEEAKDSDDSEEAEDDPFERLNEDSSEDEEQTKKYKEYLELVKNIDVQNGRILDLKQRAIKLRYKSCRSKKEEREYLRLCVEQEQENIKLKGMIDRAMLLQNFGSSRHYGDVELAITELEEDTFMAATEDKSTYFTMTTVPADLSSLNCKTSDDEQSDAC